MPSEIPNETPSHAIPGMTRRAVAARMGMTVEELTSIEIRALLKLGYGIKSAILSDPELLELLEILNLKKP